jgi:hypothetical protein
MCRGKSAHAPPRWANALALPPRSRLLFAATVASPTVWMGFSSKAMAVLIARLAGALTANVASHIDRVGHALRRHDRGREQQLDGHLENEAQAGREVRAERDVSLLHAALGT